MNTRDQFEAAWRKEYPLHGATAFKRSGVNPDAYVNTRVQDGWLMWQAGRQSASASETTLRVLPSHAIRKHEGVTIFGDPAQVLKVMVAIESACATDCPYGVDDGACKQCYADATGPVEVGESVHDDELGTYFWEMKLHAADFPSGTKVYAAPIGDNGAKPATTTPSIAVDPIAPPLTMAPIAQPAESKRVELTDELLRDLYVASWRNSTSKSFIEEVRALLARAQAKGG